jgi:hypothetical protein
METAEHRVLELTGFGARTDHPASSIERYRFSRDRSRRQTVGQFLFRNGLIPTALHHSHNGISDELRKMSVSGLAFRLDHGQKGRTDAEALDQRVLPF